MNSFPRLLRVELTRLLHRRAILVLAAAAVIAPTIIGIVLVLDTQAPSAGELARAEQQLARDLADPSYEQSVRDCIATPEEWIGTTDLEGSDLEEQCRESVGPQLEWYLYTRQLDLAAERDNGSGIAISLIVGLAMMLVGTTFTGHDWASGSVSNQLLFETRRHRVWAAKATVVTGVGLAVGALVLSTYWLVLGAVASSRGRLDDGVLLDCLQMGWRAAVLAGLAALMGFALTMLFRSTVATLGILFGIALAGGIMLSVLGIEGRWNPAYNVGAVMLDGLTYYDQVPCSVEEAQYGDYCTAEREVTLAEGSWYLGTAVVAAGAVSLLTFRRRDVP